MKPVCCALAALAPLFFPQAIRLAPNIDDRGVMEETIQDGRRQDGIPEHLPPFTETLVGRQDHAPALIAGRDQAEKEGRIETV